VYRERPKNRPARWATGTENGSQSGRNEHSFCKGIFCVKVNIMLALPLTVFVSGVWIMAKISNRDYVTQPLRQSAPPEGQKPVQQRLGYDTSAVNHHWGALDNTALRRERRFLELDLVFPFLYGVALSASSLRTWATLGRPFHAAWLMAPVAITVLADWTGISCSWGSSGVTQKMGKQVCNPAGSELRVPRRSSRCYSS